MDSQVFETSAKNGANVDLAVLALMREVLHHRKYAKEEDSTETGSESDRYYPGLERFASLSSRV